jgi:hypothetical protein
LVRSVDKFAVTADDFRLNLALRLLASVFSRPALASSAFGGRRGRHGFGDAWIGTNARAFAPAAASEDSSAYPIDLLLRSDEGACSVVQ